MSLNKKNKNKKEQQTMTLTNNIYDIIKCSLVIQNYLLFFKD